MSDEVRKSYEELQKYQLNLAENKRLEGILDSLKGQQTQYQKSLAVYDSVVPNYNRWSKVFSYLTSSVDDVNSVWIKDVVARSDGSVELTG